MTDIEFGKYHNRLCRFITDSDPIVGVIVHVSYEQIEPPPKYYLIRYHNLVEYKNAQQLGDKDKCRELSEKFDIGHILDAKILL